MESNDKLKEINIKNQNRTCYYFDDIIKFVDFELDNILTDVKSYENILIYNLTGAKPFRIRFNKINRLYLSELMMKLGVQYYLDLKNMTLFKTGLDILQKQKVVLHM